MRHLHKIRLSKPFSSGFVRSPWQLKWEEVRSAIEDSLLLDLHPIALKHSPAEGSGITPKSQPFVEEDSSPVVEKFSSPQLETSLLSSTDLAGRCKWRTGLTAGCRWGLLLKDLGSRQFLKGKCKEHYKR